MAIAQRRASDDIGGSLFIYFAMMAGVFALFVLPIYWLNSAEVHVNPGVSAYDAPRATRLIPESKPDDGPLANLARAPQPDPALQAMATENVRKLGGGRAPAPRRVAAETTGSAHSAAEPPPAAVQRPSATAMQSLSRRMSTVY